MKTCINVRCSAKLVEDTDLYCNECGTPQRPNADGTQAGNAQEAEPYIERAYAARDFDASVRILSEGLREFPSNTALLRERARCLTSAGDFRAAIRDLSEFIRLDPESGPAYNWRGRTYNHMREYDKAFADADKAIRLAPDKAVMSYDTRATARKGKGDFSGALKDYNKAIERDSSRPEFFSNRADLYMEMENHDAARNDYTKAIELAESGEDKAEYLCERAFAYWSLEKYDNAIADLTKAVGLSPGQPDAYYIRGCVYKEKKEYDRAIADFTKAMQIDPDAYDPVYERAQAYREEEDYTTAIADYTRAIQLNPQSGEAFFGRGRAYHDDDEYAKAIKDYSKALSIDPKNADAVYFRGLAHHDQEEYAPAIEDFTKAIELEAGYMRVYNLRGYCYFKVDQNYAAARDFDQAISIEPDYHENHFFRGILHVIEDEYGKALPYFRKAIRCDDSIARYHVWLGNMLHKLNINAAEEHAAYAKAMRLDPSLDEDSFWHNNDNSGSGCFITTAVCESFDRPDDCAELTAFRHFRDNWLAMQPGGAELISRYYRTAPAIVAAIDSSPGRAAVYRGIWNDYLCRCLRLIEEGQFDTCKHLYIKMVEDLGKQWVTPAIAAGGSTRGRWLASEYMTQNFNAKNRKKA